MADVVVPLAIISIVLMMVVPLPPVLLDLMLSLSIALGVGIFLTALFIERPLEFSAFPTVVLIATLLRLSLNVATTRLILLHGASGSGAAGQMVEAFGRFVVGGQILVGLVVFLILVVINFMVITKGASRIAEVAARFTLDAMPGKQMAIDAEAASGAIDAEQARARRTTTEREADFFGAMDGASKFVQGDAVAGLLITAINLVGGLIAGLVAGLDLGAAAKTFAVLSVGDALVSQIPALLVSAASGVVVTRSATGQPIGQALVSQLLGRRRAVAMTAGILALLGLLPGMPTLPCFALAGGLGLCARRAKAAGDTAGAAPGEAPAAPEGAAGRSPGAEVDAALDVDLLSLELGYELLSLVDRARDGALLDRVGALRRELARDLGVVAPAIHVCDNLELRPNAYRLLLLGTPLGGGECATDRLLAVDATGSAPPLEGDLTRDPTFDMPARWILPRDRDMAEALGYAVVDHGTVIATHMGELLRQHAARMLGRQETQHLLERLAQKYPKLVDDVVPQLLSLGDILRVLRNLLRERISIRDLRTIMESLAELSAHTKDSEQLTELVRERLAPQITAGLRGEDGRVSALGLDPRLEERLRASLRDIAAGTGGALPPEMLSQLAAEAQRSLDRFNALGAQPLLISPPDLRRYLRAIFEHKVPQMVVASYREIEPAVPLQIVDSLGRPAELKG
ncbi:MAG: flagellar biosynthesis protein FlhA [Myxococcales bacterium]|nr:flagellar biosynthesis protein FlhA [Myxococcales bacterium]